MRGKGPTKWLAWLVLVGASCGGADASPGEPAPAPAAGAEAPRERERGAADETVIEDCEALAVSANEQAHDAFALAVLCPNVPLVPSQARAALMQAATPTEIQRLLPRLPATTEVAALARLVALESPPALPPALDDPAHAIVVPVDDRVLAQTALAHAIWISSTPTPEQRTRAQAYLAKAHLHAARALGIRPGTALDPFARLLAARALQHARTFCTAHAQQRVAGLEALNTEIREQASEIVLALEASPHRADTALVAVERDRSRRYFAPADDGTQAAPASTPRPFPDEVDRLLDHGFVDLAITRALARGAETDGYGVGPAIGLLQRALRRRELAEYGAKLEERASELRTRVPPPAETGPRAIEPPGADSGGYGEAVAERARRWFASAPATGLGRRRALLRGVLLLRDEPAATLALLRAALGGDPVLGPHAGLLVALARAHDADTLAEASALLAAAALWSTPGRDTAEATTRREHALAARTAGLSPR